MVLPWTFLLLVIILIRLESVELVGKDEIVIGYQIQGATFDLVNDLYICADKAGTISSVCTGIYNKLVISSAYVMVNDTVQKRWFIASMDEKNGTVIVPLYLYGAIELSSTPWLLKTWKRIGGDWDHNLTVTAIRSSACDSMVKQSSKISKEMVASVTTNFWIMLSYSSASSLFTTTYHNNKTMTSARYSTPIGRCAFLFQQHLNQNPRVHNLSDEENQSTNNHPDESFSSRTIPDIHDNSETQTDAAMFSVQIAHCDWLAFVGSMLSMVRLGAPHLPSSILIHPLIDPLKHHLTRPLIEHHLTHHLAHHIYFSPPDRVVMNVY